MYIYAAITDFVWPYGIQHNAMSYHPNSSWAAHPRSSDINILKAHVCRMGHFWKVYIKFRMKSFPFQTLHRSRKVCRYRHIYTQTITHMWYNACCGIMYYNIVFDRRCWGCRHCRWDYTSLCLCKFCETQMMNMTAARRSWTYNFTFIVTMTIHMMRRRYDVRGENEGTGCHAMMTIIRFNKLAEEGKSSADKFSACTRYGIYM